LAFDDYLGAGCFEAFWMFVAKRTLETARHAGCISAACCQLNFWRGREPPVFVHCEVASEVTHFLVLF